MKKKNFIWLQYVKLHFLLQKASLPAMVPEQHILFFSCLPLFTCFDPACSTILCIYSRGISSQWFQTHAEKNTMKVNNFTIVWASVAWVNVVGSRKGTITTPCGQGPAAEREGFPGRKWSFTSWSEVLFYLSIHKCNEVCKFVNGNVRHDQSIFSKPPSRNGIRLTI